MEWFKSSFSFANGNCVEVGRAKSSASYANGQCVEASAVPDGFAPAKEGAEVLVRDSKDPDGPVLEFTAGEWDAFIAGAKNGEFDRVPEQTPVQQELSRLREQTGVTEMQAPAV